MPYEIRRNRDGTYTVRNAITGKVHAKRTTLRRARAQVRVMRQREGT